MASYLSTAVMTVSFLMFLSPATALITHPASLLVTVPVSFYGLITCVAAYIGMKDDKWMPISVAMLAIGLLLIATFFLTAWLGRDGNQLARTVSMLSLVILVFLDITFFSMVMKMEIFNYFDEQK